MSGYTGKTWNKVNTSKTNVQRFNNAGRAVYNNKSKANLQSALENRRAFVPNVNQLKSKVQDTGNNHPKEAIMIMGHGNEGWKPRIPIEETDDEETQMRKWKDLVPDMIRVPKGSIVVVKSHPGDITLSDDTDPEFIKAVSKENEHIILDPVKYIDDITRLFGSVSIFREGDLCPNILHAYTSIWDKDNLFKITPSGLVRIPLIKPMTNEEIKSYINSKIFLYGEKVKLLKTVTFKEYSKRNSPEFKIEDMFKLHSDPDGVNGILELIQQNLNNNELQNETMYDLIKYIESQSRIYQKEIFEYKPNTITYAFNCRAIDNHEHYVPETVRLGLQSKNNLKGIVDYSVPEGINQKRNEKNITSSLVRTNLRNIKQNNSLKLSSTRKRVKNMAGEIKQEIAESINQRRLGALSIAKANKTRNKNMSKLINNYRNKFNQSLRNNSYKHTINEIEKANPGIKDKYMSEYIDNINLQPLYLTDSYQKLYPLKEKYPNLREKFINKLNDISTLIYNNRRVIIDLFIKKDKIKDLSSRLHIDLEKYPELLAFLKEKASASPSPF